MIDVSKDTLGTASEIELAKVLLHLWMFMPHIVACPAKNHIGHTTDIRVSMIVNLLSLVSRA